MSLIVDHLYLSAVQTSKNHKFFKKEKITHVLIAGKRLRNIFTEPLYKKLLIDDNPKEHIAKHFSESIQFIHEAVSAQKNILVHCLGGKSRSVTIVVAYVMFTANMTFQQAITLVKSKHHRASPNPGFVSQLKEFEKCISEYYKQVLPSKNKEFDFKLLEKLVTEHIRWEKKRPNKNQGQKGSIEKEEEAKEEAVGTEEAEGEEVEVEVEVDLEREEGKQTTTKPNELLPEPEKDSEIIMLLETNS